MAFEGQGRATGAGSLPFTDVSEALNVMFASSPDLPYWPQLPQLSLNEGMNEQVSEGMPGLTVREGKRVIVMDDDFFVAVEELFANHESGNTDAGAISPEYGAALEPFFAAVKDHPADEAKAQISGPVTFGMSILDEEGTPILYNDVLCEVVVKHLALKARWLAARIRQAGKRPVVFVDEPFLASFGTPFFGWSKERVQEVLRATYPADAVTGSHCCSNTDWNIFLDGGADIVSFDAFEFADNFMAYKSEIAQFIERGGTIAWGIVPTDPDAIANADAGELAGRMEGMFGKLEPYGLTRAALLQHSLITPACGLGTRPADAALRAVELNADVSRRLRG